jgi:hypothetical protein
MEEDKILKLCQLVSNCFIFRGVQGECLLCQTLEKQGISSNVVEGYYLELDKNKCGRHYWVEINQKIYDIASYITIFSQITSKERMKEKLKLAFKSPENCLTEIGGKICL